MSINRLSDIEFINPDTSNMIIDTHVRIFPGEIAINAVKELNHQYGVNAIGSATVPGIRPGMNKANVDASVLLSVATRPDR